MEKKIKGCMESGEPQLCVWDDDEYTAEDCSVAERHKSAEQCKANCKLWSPSQAAQYFEAFPDEDKDTVRIGKEELAELKAANKGMREALEGCLDPLQHMVSCQKRLMEKCMCSTCIKDRARQAIKEGGE